SAPVGEGNDPVPDILAGRMHSDKDFVTIESAPLKPVVDMGEERMTHREIRRRIEIKETRQGAAVAARVNHEARADLKRPVRASARDQHTVLLEINARHLLLEAKIGAFIARRFGKQKIKFLPLHLIGRRRSRREALREADGSDALVVGERGAVFMLKARRFKAGAEAR